MGVSPSRPGRPVSTRARRLEDGGGNGGSGPAPLDLGPILSNPALYPPVDPAVQELLDACYGGAFQVGYRTDGHVALTPLDEAVASVSNASLLYGEVTPPGVVKVLDDSHLRGDRAASLLDLGCGAGKLCLQAFISHPNLAEVFGVEIAPSRHALAEQALLRLVEVAGGRYRLHRYDPGRDIVVCEEDPYDDGSEDGWAGGEHLHPGCGAGPCMAEDACSSSNARDGFERGAGGAESEEAGGAEEEDGGSVSARPSTSRRRRRRCRVLHLRCGNLFDTERARLRRTDAVVMETDIPSDLHHALCGLLSSVRPGCRLLTYLNLGELWPTLSDNPLGVPLPCPLAQCRINVPTTDRFATSWAPVSGHHFFLWKRRRGERERAEAAGSSSSRSGRSWRRAAAPPPAADRASELADLASAPVWRAWLGGLDGGPAASADTPLVSLWSPAYSSVVTPQLGDGSTAAANGAADATSKYAALLERRVSVTLPAAAVCHALTLVARPSAAGGGGESGSEAKPVWATTAQVLAGLGLACDVSRNTTSGGSASASGAGSPTPKPPPLALFDDDDELEEALARGSGGGAAGSPTGASPRGLRSAVKPLVLPGAVAAAASPSPGRGGASSASSSSLTDVAGRGDGAEAKDGRAFPLSPAGPGLPGSASNSSGAGLTDEAVTGWGGAVAVKDAPAFGGVGGGRPRSVKKRTSFRFPSRRLQRLFAEPAAGSQLVELAGAGSGSARAPAMSVSGFSGGLAAGTGPVARDEAAVLDLHASVPHDVLFALPSTTTLQFTCRLGELVWDAATCQVVALGACSDAALAASWNRTLLAIALQVDAWYLDTKEAALVAALAAVSGDVAASFRLQRRHSACAGPAPPTPRPQVSPFLRLAPGRTPMALQRPEVAPTLVATTAALRSGRSEGTPSSARSTLPAAACSGASVGASAPPPSRPRRHSWPLPVATSWDGLGVHGSAMVAACAGDVEGAAAAAGEDGDDEAAPVDGGAWDSGAGGEAGEGEEASYVDEDGGGGGGDDDGDDDAEPASSPSVTPSRWKKPWLRLVRRK